MTKAMINQIENQLESRKINLERNVLREAERLTACDLSNCQVDERTEATIHAIKFLFSELMEINCCLNNLDEERKTTDQAKEGGEK